ncbi:MAG: hypothetical protein Q8O67_30590 [Deltaproteobacteria bacterium]|nr:hypothetical protein [Deltaproteobacteria bacterium]
MTGAPMNAGDRWPRAALVFAALAPLLLFVVVEVQRPFPFTTTNDNWGYFLPLMTKTTTAWLQGDSLRVAWELGQGWSPWDSGQVGWLSPVPVVAALIARLLGDPIFLLEVDAGLHLLLLGVAAVIAPPARFTGWSRAALALALGLAPGPILVGMNWHDYLTPAPWFLLLLGLVWRALDEDRVWTAREGVAVVVVSLLFFSAGHPQMVVLGHAFLTLFALAVARSRVGVDVVVRLALAQLAVVAALFYLMWAAADAAPMWRTAREVDSLLTGALPPLQGLAAFVIGPWAKESAAAWFNPVLLLLVVVGAFKRQPRVVVAALWMTLLLVPTLAPPIEHLFVGGLAHFRFPVKLAVYAGPVAIALWFTLSIRHRDVVVVVCAAGSALVVLAGNEAGTTFNGAHAIGARGLQQLGDRCLDEAGVVDGERIAFVGDLRHSRTFAKTPLALMAVANNAPVVVGRASAHLYEPLEPAELARAHGGLTAFWRGEQLLMSNEARLVLVRRSGAQWLLALDDDDLAPLPATRACDVWFARLPDARAFPGGGIEIDSAGVLTTTTAQPAAPVLDVARALQWQPLGDGRWRAVPPLPRSDWWIAVGGGLLLSLLLARRRLPWLHAGR